MTTTINARSLAGVLYKATNEIQCMTITKNNELIILGYTDGSIELYSSGGIRGILKLIPKLSTQSILDLALSSDDRYLAVCGKEPRIFILDLNDLYMTDKTPETRGVINAKHIDNVHTRYINCVRFSNDNNYLISGSDDRTIKILNIQDQNNITVVHEIKEQGEIKTLEFISSGKSFAYSLHSKNKDQIKIHGFPHELGLQHTINVNDNTECKNMLQIFGSKIIEGDSIVRSLKITRKYIVAGLSNGCIKVWAYDTGSCITQIITGSSIKSLSIDNTDRYVASVDTNGNIRFFDILLV